MLYTVVKYFLISISALFIFYIIGLPIVEDNKRLKGLSNFLKITISILIGGAFIGLLYVIARLVGLFLIFLV